MSLAKDKETDSSMGKIAKGVEPHTCFTSYDGTLTKPHLLLLPTGPNVPKGPRGRGKGPPAAPRPPIGLGRQKKNTVHGHSTSSIRGSVGSISVTNRGNEGTLEMS